MPRVSIQTQKCVIKAHALLGILHIFRPSAVKIGTSSAGDAPPLPTSLSPCMTTSADVKSYFLGEGHTTASVWGSWVKSATSNSRLIMQELVRILGRMPSSEHAFEIIEVYRNLPS